MSRSIDWDKVREQDSDNTTAEVIRQELLTMFPDASIPDAVMHLAVYAVANAGSREYTNTAAIYDNDVDDKARRLADAVIAAIWAGMYEDRRDAAAQHKHDSRNG